MFKNSIVVRCGNCFTNTTVNSEDIYVSSSSFERGMGNENNYEWEEEVSCSNPDCDNVMKISDTVAEYPVGSLNLTDPKINGGVYVQGPDYDFHGEPDEE